MNHKILLLQLIISCVVMPVHAAANPTPFKAIYKAHYKGLPLHVVAIRELKQLEGNKYTLLSTAKSFLATITERTTFLVEGQNLTPLEYRYKRSGIGRNRKVTLNFDWQSRRVQNPLNASEMDIPLGVLDKLLYQFKMRRDLQNAASMDQPWPEMSYQIADGKRLKTYLFKVTGEEEIDTPIGKINTIKAVRIRKKDGRSTTFWLAPNYEFMLIRLKQVEKNNKGFELLLKEASFDGKPMQGYQRDKAKTWP